MKTHLLALGIAALISFQGHSQTAKDYENAAKNLTVFDDALALKLKTNIKKKDIEKISNPAIKAHAQKILDGNYNSNYLYNQYTAILSPKYLGKQLSIGEGYSNYENITGVYLPIGQHIILVDGIKNDKEVNLLIPNWLRKAPDPENPTKDPNGWGLHKKTFKLKNGINIIDLDSYGSLAYIDYYSNHPENENPIKIHFITGIVNGYFDNSKDTEEDWNTLINNETYPILDAKGKHIQIAYPKEDLKKYAYGRGKELLNNYDSLVYRQHRIMGLIKYNKVPNNRILARVNYNYYMFRDRDGVAYMGDKKGYAMAKVTDPKSVISKSIWGFSHEVGHVHQTRPMFNWGGMAEVSNNLYSVYVSRSFGNPSRLSESNNYDKSRESIIENKISFLADPDVFNRLVPFWQLQLYFEGLGEYPDFYPDLFENFRRQALADSSNSLKTERNPAIHQLNFVKTACEISKTDLTDFFNQYGFFFVGEMEYKDYGQYKYVMTQEMVDNCKQAIAAMNLSKPKTDITLIKD